MTPPAPGPGLAAAVEAAVAVLGDRARVDAPLAPLTTYRVGGPAAVLVEAASVDDLLVVAAARAASGLDCLVVGRGSNLLVADEGVPAIVVVLGEAFATIDIDHTVVRVGAAASLPVVARRTVAAGLTGFEWAVGVPGSIGGAVRMNAGGHGSDMAASLRSIRVVDLERGEDGEVPAAHLDLGYRRSSLVAHQVVVAATLDLAPGDRAAGERELTDIVRWRREHQPGGHNAGSVFTNPAGDSAGRLIDAAGCRGLRVGSAEVSTKHANFIQVDDGGRAADVIALMAEVRRRVAAHAGVVLHPETHLVPSTLRLPPPPAVPDPRPRPEVES
ncbi:MAG TPA: UDP-N-acetylmuramate dehydrogenase [Acidimicrobiales bacterium]|nr:UDP-N-acetylmuramate dehydrogenase [Acidimicrobiales bacterium]